MNIQWFKEFKISRETIYTITNKNFKRDLLDAKKIISETDLFLNDADNSEEDKCDRLYTVLKCYGKNIYERITELYLTVESLYSIEGKRNRDLLEIAKIINLDSKEFDDFPFNQEFIKDEKLNNIYNHYKKDNKDYTMTEFAGPEDKIFLFFINALQHGNSYLDNFMLNENLVFREQYETMKDLFIQMNNYVEKIWGFIYSKLENLAEFEVNLMLKDADCLYDYISNKSKNNK